MEQFSLPGIPRRPGRPKTNPLSRKEQIRIKEQNRRTELKAAGLRVLTAWIPGPLMDRVVELAEQKQLSRDKLITEILTEALPAKFPATQSAKKVLR